MGMDPAVKREFEEFTKDPARVARFSNAAMNDGYFIALDQSRIKGEMKQTLFRHEYHRFYDILLRQVKKSESHLQHIRAALFRMEAVANRGREKRSVERLFGQSEDAGFQNELRIFQAWLATLFESYLAMYGLVMGARNAERKVGEFADAFRKVLEAQRKEVDITRVHTELLKELTEL